MCKRIILCKFEQNLTSWKNSQETKTGIGNEEKQKNNFKQQAEQTTNGVVYALGIKCCSSFQFESDIDT